MLFGKGWDRIWPENVNSQFNSELYTLGETVLCINCPLVCVSAISVLVQPIDFKPGFLWLRPFRRDILGLVRELELLKEVSLVDVPLLFFMVQGSTNHQDHLPSSFIQVTRAILSLQQPVYGIALGETLGGTRCRCFPGPKWFWEWLNWLKDLNFVWPQSKWPGLPVVWFSFLWQAPTATSAVLR